MPIHRFGGFSGNPIIVVEDRDYLIIKTYDHKFADFWNFHYAIFGASVVITMIVFIYQIIHFTAKYFGFNGYLEFLFIAIVVVFAYNGIGGKFNVFSMANNVSKKSLKWLVEKIIKPGGPFVLEIFLHTKEPSDIISQIIDLEAPRYHFIHTFDEITVVAKGKRKNKKKWDRYLFSLDTTFKFISMTTVDGGKFIPGGWPAQYIGYFEDFLKLIEKIFSLDGFEKIATLSESNYRAIDIPPQSPYMQQRVTLHNKLRFLLLKFLSDAILMILGTLILIILLVITVLVGIYTFSHLGYAYEMYNFWQIVFVMPFFVIFTHLTLFSIFIIFFVITPD